MESAKPSLTRIGQLERKSVSERGNIELSLLSQELIAAFSLYQVLRRASY